MIPAIFSWSGGKDSMLALHLALSQRKFDLRYLLTTVNESVNRVSMHGLREDLLIEQVESLSLPLCQIRLPEAPDMETYERLMNEEFADFKKQGISQVLYGDIFLEDLKVYREQQLARIGMQAVFPLWKRESLEVLREFIGLGYKTIVICAKDGLQDLCGRIIDETFLAELPPGVDPCGENGEFHTFVYDGPLFVKPVAFELGERIYKTFPKPNGVDTVSGYWYIDLLPVNLNKNC